MQRLEHGVHAAARLDERRHQPVAVLTEAHEVRPRRITAPGEVGEHPLADRPGLGHHLTALLLGRLDVGLRLGVGLLALAMDLERRLLPEGRRLVVGLPADRLGVLLGLGADLGRRLPSRGEEAGRFGAEHPGHRRLVERHGLGRAGHGELVDQPGIRVLQALHLVGDLLEQGADLVTIEPPPLGVELGGGERPRRRDVDSRWDQDHPAQRRCRDLPNCGMVASIRTQL